MFLLRTVQKERRPNYYAGELYCTAEKKRSLVFSELAWISMAETGTVLCPRICRSCNFQAEGKVQTSLFVVVAADGGNWLTVQGCTNAGGVESWKDK